MSKKTNAIILLNYNDYKTVIQYVNLIKNYKSINRIVIVDNCSTDDSYSKLKKYKSDKISVIKTDENKGYAYGNNYGVHYLEKLGEKYDYITISNSDIFIKDNTIKKCINFLDEHRKVAIATPTMHMSDGKPHMLAGWKIRRYDSDIRDSSIILTRKRNMPHVEAYNKNHFKGEYSYVDCVPGSFFIIKYDIFKKVEYLDENTFLYFEEDILGKKLKDAGYKEVVLNKEKFIHYESVSINKSLVSLQKYKIIQQSKRYYHKYYNEETKQKGGKIKLLKLDIATLIGKLEIKFYNSKYYKTKFHKKMSNIRNTMRYEGRLFTIYRWIIYFIILITLPIKLLIRCLRKKEKICYFSLVTWKWIKQRPHFVALKLSEEFKVDYRYLELRKKYSSNDDTTRYVNNRINNNNLKIKPFYIFPNAPKFKKKKYLDYLQLIWFNYDKFIYTQPNHTEYIYIKALKLNKTKIYYECMDNYIGWENNKELYEVKERKLIDNSEKVFVSANKLLNNLANKYNIPKEKFILVRNGYDANLFNNYKKINTNMKQPNVTYIGTIDEWFEINNIVEYAKKYKNINFDIIGPINPSMKNKINKIKLKNIIVHGPIEHDLVPTYIENSTVMMMPFKLNEIIEYVDPVKVYEYLYFKKPIVSSYWDELKQFDGLIYYYKSNNEFESTLNQALNNKFKTNNKYKKIMEEAKWDNRLKIYIETLKNVNRYD